MMESMSAADLAAITNSNESGWGNSWFWIVVLFLFGGYGFNGRGGETQYATSAEVQRGFDNQNVMQRFSELQTAQASNAKENAQLISSAMYDNASLINSANMNNMQSIFNLTNAINQNTDGINANITGGVYGITQTLNNGFNSVNANINDLAHQLESCCCSLKSQMLQDKYDDVRNQLNLAEMASANATQTQNLLSNMGKWYPYSPVYYGTAYGTTIS